MTLNLSHRCLTVLSSDMTEGKTQVKSLLLNDNQLMLPPSEVSLFSETLCELVLDNNQLTMLPSCLVHCKQLRTLSASNNPHLSYLPDWVSQLHNLQNLWLNNCAMTSLPATSSQLSQLKRVGLEGNHLSRLPLHQSLSITWINCARNDITDDDVTTSYVSNKLHYIDLTANRLTKVPRGLMGCKTLRTFILSNNNITSFDDDMLLGYAHLATIDLRDNPLVEAPEHWKGMSHVLIGRRQRVNF